MTPIRLGPDRTCYRFHSPQWASLPLSGAGAAINGGRFNRPGVEALYLSCEPETALAEYQQGASISPPGTLVAYRLDVGDIIDFSQGFEPDRWPPVWQEVGCDWKYIARVERHEPPTWAIGDDLIRAGRRGLLFPSTRRAVASTWCFSTPILGQAATSSRTIPIISYQGIAVRGSEMRPTPPLASSVSTTTGTTLLSGVRPWRWTRSSC